MKTKCQIALSILLTFSLLGHAGQEGRGGHPLKDRFRRMGFFLSQHLEKNQIRLSARLKSLEIFKSVVKEVPIQLVEKFPDTVGSVASEVLVAITINDPKSPTGTTILLHHERFEKALAQFDKGEEAVVTIISDPNQIKIVTRENVDRFFVEQSFLSFCFHEYLLAAKEADTQTKLSSLLTASRDAYVNWSKATPGLKDESLSLKTFYFRGPVVLASGDVAADNQKALKLFYEEYDKQKVKEKNELAVKQLVEHVRKKVPVLKVTSSESSPYLYQIQYYNDYSQPGWSNYHEPVIAGVYYEQTFRSELVVDSDRKIDCSYLDGMSALSLIEGEAFTYREFVEDKKLLSDMESKEKALQAYEKALASYKKAYQEKSPTIRSLITRHVGENLIVIDDVGNLQQNFTLPNGKEHSYLLQRPGYGGQYIKGPDVVGVQYKSFWWAGICRFVD